MATANCSFTTTQISGLPSGSFFPPGVTTNTFVSSVSGAQDGVYFNTVNSTNTASSPLSIAISGNTLFYGNWNAGEISAYNIFDPSNPTLISTIDLDANTSSIYDIKIAGHYLYTVSRYGQRLQVVDISNPAAMSIVGQTSNNVFSIPVSIELNGNYAYVACEAPASVKVFDISNPANPSSMGSVDLNNGAITARLKGNYLYVTTYTGLQVVDISNPSSPAVVSSLSLGVANYYMTTVNYVNNYLYVGVTNFSNDSYIKIYDISTPSSPSFQNNFSLGSSILTKINSSGNLLYCAQQTSNAVGAATVIDVTTPTSPTIIAQSPASTRDNRNILFANNYLFTNNYNASKICVYSTPTSAQKLTTSCSFTVTVNATSTSNTNITICSNLLPYHWNGLTFNAAGSQTAHLTNSCGVDSAATLNLTVLLASTSSTSATICANQAPYVWNGNNYSSTGSYVVHFTNSVGCDSAATLNLTVNTNPTVAPIVGLTNIEILAVGGGGGAGGPDGALGAGGGAGGAVYGAYTLSTTGSSIYTVGVGGAGGYGQGCSGNAAGGTAGANGGATGGNAGTGGCSGGGGGSGGWSGLYQGSNFIVVAGGGAGGGGSNEGTANDVTTPGGGNQSAANGTSMTGQNGTAYSGDGGGGGAGGGGYYGGAGQSNLTSTGTTASQAYGGANYTNTTGRNSYATYVGTSGATSSTGTGGVGTTSTITNASNFSYSTTYGKGGDAQGNGGTNTTANGNNGVVIIRYPGSPVALGGTVSQSGGYTLHTFTTAGSNTFTANSGNSVCAGSTTTLNCATTGGVWTSSDTTIASINPSTGLVTGKVAGTVTITYTVTSAQGCIGTSTKSFTVNPLPTVPAITGNTTICDNTTTTLSNSLTGGVWSSSLPAKATVNASTGLVTSVALGSGTTTVTYLYTDNNGCSSSVNTTVTINASPTVAAIGGNTGVCIGNTTTFADATTGGTWTSGTPSVATINSSGLISTVAASASSTISYTVINANACTTVVTKPITVYALPNVTANATATTVCFGTQITLTGGNASSYTWNNGVTNNVAFAPSATTTYTVTGTDGNGCVKTANITITVNALPTVSISPSVTTLCNGYSSTLTASGASTYGWTIVGSTPYLDQVSSTSTLKLAAGLHKLKSSYSGSAIRIRRSSDNTEQDFGFVGNDLDTAAIKTFIGSGTAYVKTLYDQSGNGNHMSQTTTGNQPTLTLNGLNGKPVIHTNTSQNIYTTTNFPTPFSIVYAARQTGGSRGRVLADWNGNNWLLGWWGGYKGTAHFSGWVSSSSGTGVADNNVYVHSGTGSGSASFAYQNKTNITANSSGGTSGPNGLTMNRWQNGSEPSDADFTDLIEFNSVLSTNDRNIIENGMGAYYGLSGFYNTTGATAVVTPNTTSSFTVYGTDGNGCIGTATQSITVNPKPNAGADVDYLCGGATQTLTGTANTGTWSAMSTNPTGATLSSTTTGVATVSFANLASGTYNFIYTLPTNCTDTMSITVRPKPNSGADQAICILNVATGVTLTSNVTGSWAAMTGNAGTASIATPNAQSTLVNNFSVIGDYNYINTNNGCTDTVKITVTPAGSIGNYVWKDQNNDGLQNEPASYGTNGITVELYKKDGAGAFNFYTSTTTANDGSNNPGYYNFGICEDGVYKIKVPTINPYTQTHLTTQDTTAATNGNSDVNPADGFGPEVTINTHGTGVAKDNNTIDVGYQICTKPIVGTNFNTCGGQIVTITGISTTPALPTTDGNWSAAPGNPTGATLSTTNLGVATVQFDSLASGVYNFIYTVTGSCNDTLKITVGAKPGAGADVSSICGGHSQTVSGLPNTGTWSQSSSNASGATVGSTTNGVSTISFANAASGLYTFIYTSPFGCSDTMTIFAYPKPNAGSDILNICGGHPQTITGSPSNGTWTAKSGNPSGASLGSTSNGVANIGFTNASSGTYTFIYTVPSGCTDTMIITANPKPNAGSDISSICGGQSQTLSGLPSIGVWSQLSSNQSGATVGSTTNGVSTIRFANAASGLYTFILTVPSSCTDTMTIFAYPKPNAGSDVSSVCGDRSQVITASPTNGVWTAMYNNPNGATLSTISNGVANVDFADYSSGLFSFIYTVPSGCTDTMTIRAYPKPDAGSDYTEICGGSIIPAVGTPSGGTWSQLSSNASGATVGSTSSGVANISFANLVSGTYTFIYTMGSGCSDTMTISTKPKPDAGADKFLVCGSTQHTDFISATPAGGTWDALPSNPGGVTLSSTNASGGASLSLPLAPTTGVWSFVYTAPNGCTDTMTYTIGVIGNPSPAINGGSNPICNASTVQLCPTVFGWGNYQWYRNGVAIPGQRGANSCITIDTSNVGSYTLSGTNGSACWSAQSTPIVITKAAPSTPTISASGSTTVCAGSSVVLTSSAAAGNQWNKNGVAISGATTQTYAVTTSGIYTVTVTTCGSATSTGITVTVNNAITVAPIVGSSNTACMGTTVSLTDSTTGGVWTSSNTAVATISNTGVVTPVSAGTVTISYTVTVSGCSKTVTYSITVPSGGIPTAPTLDVRGSTAICGTSILQICPATFGWSNYQWYKNGVAIAAPTGTGACINIDTSALGSYTLKGTNSAGCWSPVSTAVVVTRASAPATPTISASGATSICNGASVTLTSSAATGNQWNKDGVAISGATSQTHAAIASGVYTVTASNCGGSTTSAGTSVTVAGTVTVAAIAGINSVCLGSSTTLSNATAGGVWTSSNAAIATVDASSGVVTPVSVGTVTISYTVTVGSCSNAATYTLTVPSGSIPASPVIAAQSSTVLCGATTVQLCPTAYGWSNYQWYKDGVAVTNNGASACIVLDSSKPGSYTLAATMGTCWSAQSNAVSIIKAAGPSTPTISASGSTTICAGSNVTLTSTATSGNQWNKDGVAISGATSQTYAATTSGVYTVTVTNCGSSTSTGTTVTVASPITVAAITGSNIVCLGSTTTLANATAGGVWTSSNTAVATVSSSGVVTSVAAGTSTISYTVTVGSCSNAATYSVTVPTGSIVAPTLDVRGSTAICGTTILQICPATFGYSNYQWYKNGVAIAAPTGTGACINVDTSALGSYTLKGTNSAGCWSPASTAVVVTRASAPATPTVSASGATTICNGSSVTLTSSTTTGNQWNKNGVAISGATSQTYAATASGVYTVTTTVCGSITSAGTTVTVSAPITITPIAGNNSVCVGSSTTLSNATAGGVWSSSNTAVATISNTGVVTTVSAGTTVISYTVTAGSCSNAATYTLTVPAGSVTTPTLDIRGSVNICGSNSLQICPLAYGYSNFQWYKDGVPYSTSACITVNTAGAYTLTGTNGSGCWSSPSIPANVTINALPTVAATTGAANVCIGSSTTLTNSSTIPSGGTGVWSTPTSGLVTVNANTGLVTALTGGASAPIYYTVTSAVGCISTAIYTINLKSLPSVPSIQYASGTPNPQTGPGGSFCANKTFTVVGNPTGGVWSKTGVISVTTPGGVVSTGSVAGSGSLTYTYTDGFGCSNSRSIVSNVAICAGPRGVNTSSNDQVVGSNEFTMFPNPAKTFISLNLNTLTGAGSIVVTDLYGKQVKRQSLSMGSNTVDVANLSKGFYLVSIITEQGKTTKKLIVE